MNAQDQFVDALSIDFAMQQDELELDLQPMYITPVLPPGLFLPQDTEMSVEDTCVPADSPLANCTAPTYCGMVPSGSVPTGGPLELTTGLYTPFEISSSSTFSLPFDHGSVTPTIGLLASPFILQESSSSEPLDILYDNYIPDSPSSGPYQVNPVEGAGIETVIAAFDDLSFERGRTQSDHSTLGVDTLLVGDADRYGILPTPPASPPLRMPKRKRVATCLGELSPVAKKRKTRCVPDHLQRRFLKTRR